MQIGKIVFKHNPRLCPIANISKKLPNIIFFSQIVEIKRKNYTAKILVESKSSEEGEKIIEKIRKILPYHSDRVDKYEKPRISSGIIECELLINDGGSTSNIIRFLDSIEGASIHPTLLHKTVNGIGEVTVKIKDKSVFDSILDKMSKSYEVKVYREKCSCYPPEIGRPFYGYPTIFDLYLDEDEKERLWTTIEQAKGDFNFFMDKEKKRPQFQLSEVLRYLSISVELLKLLKELFS